MCKNALKFKKLFQGGGVLGIGAGSLLPPGDHKVDPQRVGCRKQITAYTVWLCHIIDMGRSGCFALFLQVDKVSRCVLPR